MDCVVHGVAKSWTQLSNFHFHPDIWQTYQNLHCDVPDDPVIGSPPAGTGDIGSIPGPGRFHMPQLRVLVLQLQILHAETKPWCSQINIYFFKEEEDADCPSVDSFLNLFCQG